MTNCDSNTNGFTILNIQYTIVMRKISGKRIGINLNSQCVEGKACKLSINYLICYVLSTSKQSWLTTTSCSK